jgi:hypothetical protein
MAEENTLAAVGNLELPKIISKRVFKIDSNWRIPALEDKDLEPLWNEL